MCDLISVFCLYLIIFDLYTLTLYCRITFCTVTSLLKYNINWVSLCDLVGIIREGPTWLHM